MTEENTEKRSLFERFVAKLPVVSLFYHFITKDTENTSLEQIGHIAYGAVSIGFASAYGFLVAETKEWNPLKQIEASINIRSENIKLSDKFDANYNLLFRPQGLADANRDGVISFVEQYDAWNRMGLANTNKPYFESSGNGVFPRPNLQQLEKAVESYKQSR